MKTYFSFILTFLFFTANIFAQNEIAEQKMPSVFERITEGMKNYKLDTLTPPDDKSTRLIVELRELKGGFNINEFIQFKMDEESQKPENNNEEFRKAMDFFTQGNGKKWLDNAVVNIYRNHYTEKELKALVKFARTPAGQKMASETPLIILQTVTAGEMLKEQYLKEKKE